MSSQSYSSEALKIGKLPPKHPSCMTPEELRAFRATHDPDAQGFDGHEGMVGGDKNGNQE